MCGSLQPRTVPLQVRIATPLDVPPLQPPPSLRLWARNLPRRGRARQPGGQRGEHVGGVMPRVGGRRKADDMDEDAVPDPAADTADAQPTGRRGRRRRGGAAGGDSMVAEATAAAPPVELTEEELRRREQRAARFGAV
jgi:hypothetical protein